MDQRHTVIVVALICAAIAGIYEVPGWGWFIFIAFLCL